MQLNRRYSYKKQRGDNHDINAYNGVDKRFIGIDEVGEMNIVRHVLVVQFITMFTIDVD